MDNQQLAEFVDQHRWLLNNGLITDSVKNQLFFYGSIVHKDVQAVDVKLLADKKTVEYTIFVSSAVIKQMAQYKKLSTATSLFGLWRFKRFLKKNGTLDFQSMLSTFVMDFCGPKWITRVTVANFDAYIDSIGDEIGTGEASQQPDKLPD